MSDRLTPYEDTERKSGKTKAIVIAVVLVAIVVVAVIAYNALSSQARDDAQLPAQEEAAAQEAQGAQDEETLFLADFDATVYAENDTPATLTSLNDGRPLVINFWATWCPYCIEEMPDYQKLYDEFSDRVAFAFIDCNDGVRETKEMAQAWMVDNGLSLPQYFDTDGEAARSFDAYSLPTSIIVDKDGKIYATAIGMISYDRMREVLAAIS